MTFEGLADQLLADILAMEKPELERKFREINGQMNRDRENIAACEERILGLLDQPSELTILDDQELLGTL